MVRTGSMKSYVIGQEYQVSHTGRTVFSGILIIGANYAECSRTRHHSDVLHTNSRIIWNIENIHLLFISNLINYNKKIPNYILQWNKWILFENLFVIPFNETSCSVAFVKKVCLETVLSTIFLTCSISYCSPWEVNSATLLASRKKVE